MCNRIKIACPSLFAPREREKNRSEKKFASGCKEQKFARVLKKFPGLINDCTERRVDRMKGGAHPLRTINLQKIGPRLDREATGGKKLRSIPGTESLRGAASKCALIFKQS